jgi:hypothetical protein
MKTPHQLSAAAKGRSLVLDPNSETAQQMMATQRAQAMAAQLVIEAASSIYVRVVSEALIKDPEIPTKDQYKAIAGAALEAGKALLEAFQEDSEPKKQDKPELEGFVPTAVDANGSPVAE